MLLVLHASGFAVPILAIFPTFYLLKQADNCPCHCSCFHPVARGFLRPLDGSPGAPWRVVFPGTRHGDTHRPGSTAPVAANLGLRPVHCPPLPTRDLLPVGHRSSTHPGPAADGTTAKDGSTHGACDKHQPPAARQPLQPHGLLSRHLEEKAMLFPPGAQEFRFL